MNPARRTQHALRRRAGAQKALWAGLVATAVIAGAFVAHSTVLTLLIIGALAVAVAGILFSSRPGEVLVCWVALEAVAFPFVRVGNLVTFDRFMVLALGGALLLVTSRPQAKESRTLTVAIATFTAIYGIRAATTVPLPLAPGSEPVSWLQPYADWLDLVLLPCLVFLVASRTIGRDRWRPMAIALTVLGVSTALLGLVEWTTGFHLAPLSGSLPFVDDRSGVVRITGPFADPTAYGCVLVIALASSMYLLQIARNRLLPTAALFVEIVGLVPSYTKGVWGAGLITIILAFGVRERFMGRVATATVGITALLCVVFVALQSNPVIVNRVTGEAARDNVSSRLGAYEQGVHIFERWPVYGAGINQFIAAQYSVEPVSVSGVAATTSAHNTLLNVLAETGLIGFSALLFVIVATLRLLRGWRRRAKSHEEFVFGACGLAAVAGYVVLSLPFTLLYSPPSTALLAVVLGATAARIDEADVQT